MAKIINRVLNVIFLILMSAIMFATIILDKNVDSNYGNTVLYHNIYYYLISTILIIFIVIWVRKPEDMNKTLYLALSAGIMLLVLVGWQIPVGKWIYYWLGGGDFGAPMGAAIGFNEGGSFIDWPYFLDNPNNANLAILLSWIYKIIPNWRFVIILGAFLTNLSAVLVEATVYNYTGCRKTSLITLIVSEIVVAMTWRAFIVYTDNFGMIFVALIMWVYSLQGNEKMKILLISAFGAIGTFIKPTVFICILTIIIHRIIVNLLNNKLKLQAKTIEHILFTVVTLCLVFSGMIIVQRELRNYHLLDLTGQYPKGWQYMFLPYYLVGGGMVFHKRQI